MKNFFPTSILLLFSFTVYSQEPADGVFPLKDSAIYYERIITLDSTTKENIYKAVKSWGVNAFKSQKVVLQADDKEIGLIAYKYWFGETFTAVTEKVVKVSTEWKYDATMKIFIKDNKVKIVVQNVELKDIGRGISGSILTIMADSQKMIKELEASDKTYAKYSKKINTPELRQQQFDNTKRNFEKANKSILATIESLVTYLKSGKAEFEF